MKQQTQRKLFFSAYCAIAVLAIMLFFTALGMSLYETIGEGGLKGDNHNIQAPVAEGAKFNIYSLVTPKIINFYERNIAGHPVASNIKGEQRVKMMEEYGIKSTSKLSGLLIIQNLVKINGGNIDLATLSKMKDGDVFALAKKNMETYKNSLSPEQKKQLDAKFNELKTN